MKNEKRILHIGTGGTISSVPSEEGLVPQTSAELLLQMVPVIQTLCRVDCVQPLCIDSTNMRPAHWMLLADTIREHYDQYDGFVITHGTDTMAYTAAALSYLIQDSPKPIVLTGAQKPAGEIGSDAIQNIEDAFRYVCDDGSSGVQIVFSGAVIAGTRARKMFSKRFAAFSSINFPELAHVQDGRVVRYFADAVQTKPTFYEYINPSVGLIKFVPGMRNDVLRYLIDQYDGLVVESFGVGGLPEYSDFFEQVKRGVELGKLIVMTTQVPNEGSDLSVYRVGVHLKSSLHILEAHDMTTEAALTKLMWVLGQTEQLPAEQQFAAAERLFYQTIGHDILCK